jgi:hypothetical protein
MSAAPWITTRILIARSRFGNAITAGSMAIAGEAIVLTLAAGVKMIPHTSFRSAHHV